jgi:alpha-tubulin suppressor-like RCC1 family protein
MGGQSIYSISVGARAALALTKTGFVYAWGTNTNYQLGNGAATSSAQLQPLLVNFGALQYRKAVLLAVGSIDAMVVTNDNQLVGWGSNTNGALGDGTVNARTTPVVTSKGAIGATRKIVGLYMAYHTMVLTDDNRLFTWGYNAAGQLGDGSTNNRYQPNFVYYIGDLYQKTISKIAVGGNFNLVLTSGT